MTEIQFHFDPIPPTPGGGEKFPWKPFLIALGLFALFFAFAYAISKPETKEIPSIPDDDLPNDRIL